MVCPRRVIQPACILVICTSCGLVILIGFFEAGVDLLTTARSQCDSEHTASNHRASTVAEAVESGVIVAHRGGGTDEGQCIENSICSAIGGNKTTNFLEIDVDLSADGHAVLFHDRTLERLAHPDVEDSVRMKSPRELTLHELENIPLAVGTERIATLRSLLESFRHDQMLYMIDIKQCEDCEARTEIRRDSVLSCCERVVRSVFGILADFPAINVREHVVFSSTQPEVLRIVKKQSANSAKATLSMDLRYALYSRARLIRTLKTAQADGISGYYRFVQRRARSLRAIQRQRPLLIFVWTVNDRQIVCDLLKTDFPAIISDFPHEISKPAIST